MSDRITLDEFRSIRSKGVSTSLDKKRKSARRVSVCKKKSKYNAKKVTINGMDFDSKIEGQRYVFLLEQERSGKISNLSLQDKFDIFIGDNFICSYLSDFCYTLRLNGNALKVVEDVKGIKTPIYRLKKKLLKASHDIDIKEITAENVTSI